MKIFHDSVRNGVKTSSKDEETYVIVSVFPSFYARSLLSCPHCSRHHSSGRRMVAPGRRRLLVQSQPPVYCVPLSRILKPVMVLRAVSSMWGYSSSLVIPPSGYKCACVLISNTFKDTFTTKTHMQDKLILVCSNSSGCLSLIKFLPCRNSLCSAEQLKTYQIAFYNSLASRIPSASPSFDYSTSSLGETGWLSRLAGRPTAVMRGRLTPAWWSHWQSSKKQHGVKKL